MWLSEWEGHQKQCPHTSPLLLKQLPAGRGESPPSPPAQGQLPAQECLRGSEGLRWACILQLLREGARGGLCPNKHTARDTDEAFRIQRHGQDKAPAFLSLSLV